MSLRRRSPAEVGVRHSVGVSFCVLAVEKDDSRKAPMVQHAAVLHCMSASTEKTGTIVGGTWPSLSLLDVDDERYF